MPLSTLVFIVGLKILPIICVMTFAGIWIEKGMGLLLPGFTPSPIGELSEYYPTWVEIVNSLGNWAIGLAVFTILLKGAVGILLGDISHAKRQGG